MNSHAAANGRTHWLKRRDRFIGFTRFRVGRSLGWHLSRRLLLWSRWRWCRWRWLMETLRRARRLKIAGWAQRQRRRAHRKRGRSLRHRWLGGQTGANMANRLHLLDHMFHRGQFRYGVMLRVMFVFAGFMIVFVIVMAMAIRGLAAGTQRTRIRAVEAALEFDGNLFVYGAGMRLFLLHTQFGQHVDDDAGLDLKFPSQLVDSDFLHRRDCWITPYKTLLCGGLFDFTHGIRFYCIQRSRITGMCQAAQLRWRGG